LAVEGESNMLVAIAGAGVVRDDVELFSWPLSDARDPLVAALSALQPILFRQARANGHPLPTTPLGAGAFTAVPPRGIRHPEEAALGLLLVRSGNGLSPDVGWLVTVLGQKIEQARGRGSLSEEVKKLRRERTLFFTIINSVTDPILLTDTEGRLIVANARAEKLFAATEEESEGRRRAVELNNMLFSAALSRTAVADASAPAARELL